MFYVYVTDSRHHQGVLSMRDLILARGAALREIMIGRDSTVPAGGDGPGRGGQPLPHLQVPGDAGSGQTGRAHRPGHGG